MDLMNRRIARHVSVLIPGSDVTPQVNVFLRSGFVMEKMIVVIQLLPTNILTMDAMQLFANRMSFSVTTSSVSFNDSTVMLMMIVVMEVMNHHPVPWQHVPRISTSVRTNDAFPKSGCVMVLMTVVMILMKIFASKTKQHQTVLRKSLNVRTRIVLMLLNCVMDPMIVETFPMNDIVTLMNAPLDSPVHNPARIVPLDTSAPAFQVAFLVD